MAKTKKGKQKQEIATNGTLTNFPQLPTTTYNSPANPSGQQPLPSPQRLPPPALAWSASPNASIQRLDSNEIANMDHDGVSLNNAWSSMKKADSPATHAQTPSSGWSAKATKATTPATTTTTKITNIPPPKTQHQHKQSQHYTSASGGKAWYKWGKDEPETESESESEDEVGPATTSWGGGAGGAWGNKNVAGPWGTSKTMATATNSAPKWQSWGEEAQRNNKVNQQSSSFPAVAAGSRNNVSPLQRSQIIEGLLSVPQAYVSQQKHVQQATAAQNPTKHFSHIPAPQQYSSKQKSQTGPTHVHPFPAWQTQGKPSHEKGKQHRHTQSENQWNAKPAAGDWFTDAAVNGRKDNGQYGWGPIPEEDEDDYEDARRVHFSPKPASNVWGAGDKSPMWGGGKAGKADSLNGWGSKEHAGGWWNKQNGGSWGDMPDTAGAGGSGWDEDGDGWPMPSKQGHGHGWGEEPTTQGNSPWGAFDSKDDSSFYGLLERPKGKARSEASYSMPSKTLAYAYHGTTTQVDPKYNVNSILADYSDIEIQESEGVAFQQVERAFFGGGRKARERIHWMFPPDKDERVESLLNWIQNASHSIGTFGAHKFIQTRERGALFTNADFRAPDNTPVFDWLTFDDLQQTKDKVLQESVMFYDPAVQVIVFVFLPSKTGNSVAMWRRKIPVPNNTRLSFQGHINQALAGLRRDSDYIVHVDELSNEMPPLTKSQSLPAHLGKSKKKKRKWWKKLFGG